jgi:hypothetical protein
MHKTKKNVTSYKCEKYRENIRNRTMKIKTISKRMYDTLNIHKRKQ